MFYPVKHRERKIVAHALALEYNSTLNMGNIMCYDPVLHTTVETCQGKTPPLQNQVYTHNAQDWTTVLSSPQQIVARGILL